MSVCGPNTGRLLTNLPPSAPVNINIDCVPTVSGQPTYTPQPDQLPFAFDPATGILWIHQCPNTWFPFNYSLCALTPAQITGLANPCQTINVPITYDRGQGCEVGVVPLQDFSAEVAACLNLGTGGPISVASGSTNVVVNQSVVNGVTTFTVTVAAAPLSNVIEVQQDGNLIATHDDGSGQVARIEETITTFTRNVDGSYTYTNEVGATTIIPAPVVTSLVRNMDGSFTFTNEDGDTTIIPAPQYATMVANADGSFTFNSPGSTPVLIPAPTTPTTQTLTSLNYNAATGALDYVDENNVTNSVPLPPVNETATFFTQDVNGNFVYTNEVNSTFTIPAETVTAIVPNATTGGFDYRDELGAFTPLPGGVTTTLDVNAATGQYEYTNEANTVTTLPPFTTSGLTDQNIPTPTKAVNQIAEHDDGAGGAASVQPINETVTTMVANATLGGFDFTNELGTVVNIPTGSGALTGGGGITIVGNAINADGGASQSSVPQTITTNQLGNNFGGQFIYTRQNPNKQVMVIIDARGQLLFDPQAAGIAGSTTDMRGEFTVNANINGTAYPVVTTEFDTEVRTITASADEAFFTDESATAHRLVNANTVTVEMGFGPLSLFANGTTVASTNGALWGTKGDVTITFVEV